MRAGALVVAFGVLLGAARTTEACSCPGEPLVRPEDGAVDVPLNARVLVLASWIGQVDLRRRDDAVNVVLSVEDSVARYGSTRSVLARPLPGLDPETTYEVVLEGLTGQLVVSTFTTGSLRDDVAPEFTGATAIQPRRWRADGTYYSSCWTRDEGTDSVLVEHQAFGPDVAGAIMEVRRQGDPGPPWRTIHPVPLYAVPWLAPGQSWLSSDLCGYTNAPDLDEPGSYCVRVTAFDLAGNVAGAGVETCGVSETCRLDDTVLGVTPSTPCDPTPYPPAPAPDGGSGGEADGGYAGAADDGGGCAVATGRSRALSGQALLLLLGFTALVLRSRRWSFLVLALILGACGSSPPEQPDSRVGEGLDASPTYTLRVYVAGEKGAFVVEADGVALAIQSDPPEAVLDTFVFEREHPSYALALAAPEIQFMVLDRVDGSTVGSIRIRPGACTNVGVVAEETRGLWIRSDGSLEEDGGIQCRGSEGGSGSSG